MIREFIVWLNEALFYLQGGVMLASTPWIVVWILFWTAVMSVALARITWSIDRSPGLSMVLAVCTFFPSLVMAIGPSIVQQQMMTECRDQPVSVNFVVDGEISGDSSTVVILTKCRHKENFYGEFGEWKIVNSGLTP